MKNRLGDLLDYTSGYELLAQAGDGPLQERLPEHLDAKLILAVHDELVVECPEDQAEEVSRFVEEVMVAGMDEIVNPGLDDFHPDRAPVEVLEDWGG